MTDLDRTRQHLASDLAKALVGDGIDAILAGTMAQGIAAKVTFDPLGCPLNIGDLVAEAKLRDADLFAVFTPPKPDGTAAADHRSPLDRQMAAAREAAERDRQRRVDELRAAGNPFSAATRNLTRQGLLFHLAPALAQRLQAEANA